MKLEIDVENNLQQYLPSIFLLLNDKKINWNKISRKYQKELYSRKERLFGTGKVDILIEGCLLDIISKTIQSDFSHYTLLRFIDDLFTELAKNTTDKEKLFLRDSIYNVLINTDTKYLNFIGEFAILNHFKRLNYELIQSEQELDKSDKNSTRVDFTLSKASETYMIEVVNIHFPDHKELNNKVIDSLLTQKINNKLKTKRKNSNILFHLIPVLWGDYSTIKLVNEYYKNSKVSFKNTFPPFAFMSYKSEDKTLLKYRFGMIDKLILSE